MNDGRSDDWTGGWARKKLLEDPGISAVELMSSSVLRISRRGLPDAVVATMSAVTVTAAHVRAALGERDDVVFIANIKSGAHVAPDALQLARRSGAALGGFGDLMSAMSLPNPGDYVSKEMTFVMNSLRQHTKITNIVRLDDRRLELTRSGLPTVIVLVLNDYEFTVERVRSVRSQYGRFDAIVASNPNCRPSTAAVAAAEAAGIQFFIKWGSFLGALNRRW